MPEDKNAKTVDIDTSGPEVDVELEDTSKPESEVIETVEQEAAPKAEKPSDAKVATESQATSPSPQEASDENKTQKGLYFFVFSFVKTNSPSCTIPAGLKPVESAAGLS